MNQTKETTETTMRTLLELLTTERGGLTVDVIGGAALTVTIRVNRADMLKVIGSRGIVIRSIQTLFAKIGEKAGQVIEVMLLEPMEGTPPPAEKPPFRANPKWIEQHAEPVFDLFRTVLRAIGQKNKAEMHHGGDITKIEVRGLVPAEISGALVTIWNSIGKATGRTILLQFIKPARKAATP